MSWSDDPVFLAESRKPGRGRTLVGWGSVALVTAFAVLLAMDLVGGEAQFWRYGTSMLTVYLFAVVPPLVGTCVQEERDRGTGEGLILSAYSAHRILAAKLAVRLLPVVATVLLVEDLGVVDYLALAWRLGFPSDLPGWSGMVLNLLFPIEVLLLAIATSLGFGAARSSAAGAIAVSYLSLLLSLAAGLAIPLSLFRALGLPPYLYQLLVLGLFVGGLPVLALLVRWAFRRTAARLESCWSGN